LIPGRFLRL